jgi:tryptophan synthase alpha chain
MNKTAQYITSKKDSLSVYFTSEYPKKNSTKEVILALQTAGVDLLEIGIPFSDPLADGPVIQKSSMQALENGFTLENLFSDLEDINSQVKIPLVLMGYFNTLLAYGVENFLKKCKSLNIDSVIFPDLPPEVYQKSYRKTFDKHGVSPVFLITPQTSDERIKMINNLSETFIYIVADNSITGAKGKFSAEQLAYFQRIKDFKFKVPVMIGFGISDHNSYKNACEYADGVIIGSAFIKSIKASNNIEESVQKFIKLIKNG